jgi:exopolysaccharide biosynthesis polyprenyl glycosylphosphotransferase
VWTFPLAAEWAAWATAAGALFTLPGSWPDAGLSGDWGAALLLAGWGLLITRAVVRDARQRRRRRRVIVLGAGPLAAWLIEAVESTHPLPCTIVGVCDWTRPIAPGMARRWLGSLTELEAIIARERPERLVIAADERRGRLPLASLLDCRIKGLPVDDALSFYERVTGKIAIEALGPAGLILSDGFRTAGGSSRAARALSVLVAGPALVALSPVLAVVALAIVLDSRGPVLFVQERIGKDGRPFRLLKFRTMVPSPRPHSEWVRDNGHRITRVGRWLRHCRADELPQLVNVLRGEMNLVGPRPHPTTNARLFLDHIEFYQHRTAVLPGLTGWAQVRQGYANDLSEETEKMRYDLYYIKNRTVWLDLRILLETVSIMLRGRGASAVQHRALARPSPLRRPVVRLAWPAAPHRSMGRS